MSSACLSYVYLYILHYIILHIFKLWFSVSGYIRIRLHVSDSKYANIQSELQRVWELVFEMHVQNHCQGSWLPSMNACNFEDLIRSYHPGAPVLLMDEPTSALDGESEESCWPWILKNEKYQPQPYQQIVKQKYIYIEVKASNGNELHQYLVENHSPTHGFARKTGGRCPHFDSIS